jgi:two-component system, chemotaxis family, sensor kinase CheA
MTNDHSFGAEFMDDYFAECEEHLAAIRQRLLDLEGAAAADRPVRSGALEELFRHFHSIKGISGMVELREAELLAHHMESYLRALREREARLTDAGLDALVRGVDALEQTISARRDNRGAPAIEPAVARLVAVSEANPDAAAGAPAAEAPSPGWRISFTPSAALIARGINVDTVRARIREAGEILDATPRVTPNGIAFDFLVGGDIDPATIEMWRADGFVVSSVAGPIEPSPPVSGEAIPDAGARLAPSHVVRVDLTRLDDLMRMIGDLVISRARLEDTLARIERHVPPVEWRAVSENLQTIERQLRDLREGVMRVRLVPVGEIFRRMPFVVRDLIRDTGTRVRLDLRGQDTEIDKFLIERMMDPVLHLVRNAVSHAFEPPDERRAAGKPEEGTLTLAAASIGDAVVLEIADDGRGIDNAAVAARARSMGLTVPDGPLDSTALLDLICAPGFSTRDETDRASGRGVGMAVVKTTVEDLNGRMSVQTERGRGTRFVIELPLTLSITDALIAHVGERTFAVPQGNVREIVEIEPAAIRAIERREIAPLREGSLPIVRLGALFGIPAHPGRALHVLVVGVGSDAVGFAVDRVSGQREIVVRSTADSLIDVPGVSGATDLGDGRVVLILNLPDLARHAKGRAAAAGAIGSLRS